MATEIKCPHCGHKFPMEEAVSEEYKKELREQMLSYKKQKDEEMNKREVQLNESIRKSVSADFENRLKLLQQAQADNEEKLKTARTREMEFLRKEQELQTKEQELELTVQRQLLKERGQLSEKIRLEEAEKIAMRETEHQLRV